MGWDVCLKIDSGGPEPVHLLDIGNYTYNCNPIFVAANGESMSAFHRMDAGEAHKIFRKVLDVIEEDLPKYEAMNPPNGWGDVRTFIDFLRNISDACRDNPKAILWIT